MIERPHTQLPVWQKTMQLIHLVYTVTGTFPESEKEGLGRKIKNRLTDIPVAIASALANGLHQASSAHLRQALDAITEVETLLLVATRVSILRPAEFEQYQDELIAIQQEISLLINRIDKKKRS